MYMLGESFFNIESTPNIIGPISTKQYVNVSHQNSGKFTNTFISNYPFFLVFKPYFTSNQAFQ